MNTFFPFAYKVLERNPEDREFLTGGSGSESGSVNIELQDQMIPDRGLFRGELNSLTNSSSTPSTHDDAISLELLNKPESPSLRERLGTLVDEYSNSARRFAHIKVTNFALSTILALQSIVFLGMGFGYMDKCESSALFPVICIIIGVAGILIASSNLLILVKGFRISDRAQPFEIVTSATLLLYDILFATALRRLTEGELDPTRAVEYEVKCDPGFLTFFKVGSIIGITTTTVMAVIYLPLLCFCRNKK